MFRKIPLLRLCSLMASSLAAMVAAPSALGADACSCMCVDATPYYVCTGFVTTQTQTAACDTMQCPSVDEPAPEPTTEPDPVEEPVATIEPPHPGLVCERRSVYRPDLGRYKKYKVCKPSAKERHGHKHHANRHAKHHAKHQAKHRAKHARKSEAWAARNERVKAHWEAKTAKHRARHGHHDDHDEDEG